MKYNYVQYIYTHTQTMSYEPWYQTSSPSKADVTNSVKGEWFLQNLYKEENTADEDTKLRTDLAATTTTSLTITNFNDIRGVPNWKDKCEEIMEEEVDKEFKKGVGSYRGYWTFVHTPLCKTIRDRFIGEIIKKIKAREIINRALKIMMNNWIEKRFEPGGKGFLETQTHFNALNQYRIA